MHFEGFEPTTRRQRQAMIMHVPAARRDQQLEMQAHTPPNDDTA